MALTDVLSTTYKQSVLIDKLIFWLMHKGACYALASGTLIPNEPIAHAYALRRMRQALNCSLVDCNK